MTALALYWLFLRVVLLSFSGFATVPVIRHLAPDDPALTELISGPADEAHA